MGLEELRTRIPDHAKDIRLNLGSLASDESLTDQQKWGAFFAAAIASKNTAVIQHFAQEAEANLSSQAIEAAKTAAAIMAMNNVYYRSLHLMKETSYQNMPAKLRMNAIAKPSVDKVDFELWSLCVSAVNGCGMCLDSHEKVLRENGVTSDAIQTTLRIAAVVHAAAAILTVEEALN